MTGCALGPSLPISGIDFALDLERSNLRIITWLPNFCTGLKDGNKHDKQFTGHRRCSGDGWHAAIPHTPETAGTYTVQQAAALTGLSEHTLRYYERIGLIQPVARQESSGHRRYGPADLAKLETPGLFARHRDAHRANAPLL